MNRRNLMTAGVVAAATLPFAARAQQSAMMADGTIDPEKAPVVLAGTASKVMSQVALEKGSDNVKAFAQLEVAEQTAVGAAFGVPADAPPQVSQEDAAMIEQLKAAEAGAAFDTMYIDGQIAGHTKLRDLAASYASNGADPMAKGGAMVAVTEIDTHLVMLNAMKSMMG